MKLWKLRALPVFILLRVTVTYNNVENCVTPNATIRWNWHIFRHSYHTIKISYYFLFVDTVFTTCAVKLQTCEEYQGHVLGLRYYTISSHCITTLQTQKKWLWPSFFSSIREVSFMHNLRLNKNPQIHVTYSTFVLLDVRDNIQYLCCLSMHRQQAEREPHSWSSVRATQHAALSSLLWAGPSTPPPLPVAMLRLRLVSFFSSLAKEMTFFLSSRTTWKQKQSHVAAITLTNRFYT